MTNSQSLYLDGQAAVPGEGALSDLGGLVAAAEALLDESGDLSHRGQIRLARQTGDLAELQVIADAIRADFTDVAGPRR